MSGPVEILSQLYGVDAVVVSLFWEAHGGVESPELHALLASQRAGTADARRARGTRREGERGPKPRPFA